MSNAEDKGRLCDVIPVERVRILGCACVPRGAVLVQGEICLLTGAGGCGKSTLAVQWAFDIAAGHKGVSAGMRLAEGLEGEGGHPVVYASAEDDKNELRRRADNVLEKRDLEGIPANLNYYSLHGKHLYSFPNESEKVANAWKLFWANVAALGAKFVVIDPLFAIFAGDPNCAVATRAFLSALSFEAKRHGTSVLLLTHSNKQGRGKDSSPFNANTVQGSTQLHDGVRGVLSLTAPNESAYERTLHVVKANYGRRGIQYNLLPELSSEEDFAVFSHADTNGWRAPGEVA